ncbi:MAG TPA: hypothetical protein DHU69_07090, partial [Deltaproteobacteria bacterium]|nr:hypothetical protein [Deltaproteobacteria bacterium]
MTILKKIREFNWQAIRENKLYWRFASLKTSVIFLGILVFFYIIGTIFPQGGEIDDYIRAGGRFSSFVIFFNLLELFTTPIFLLSALLLFINLSICTFERLLLLLSQKTLKTEELQFIPSYTLLLDINPQLEDAFEGVREIFKKELRFREQTNGSDREQVGSVRIIEKGWSYKWLTWIYHVAIAFCFVGFLLTYLFAFEDGITLYPNEHTKIMPTA